MYTNCLCILVEWASLHRSSEYATAKEAFDEKYARQQVVLQKIRPQVHCRLTFTSHTVHQDLAVKSV